MLYGMAKKGDAPKAFLKLSKKGVPVRAILFSTVFSYIAVIFSYVSPDKIFLFLINSSGAVALLVYLVIAFSQLRMRRLFEKENPEALQLKMWLFPYLTYITIFCIAGIFIAMLVIESLRVQAVLTLLIAGLTVASYFIFVRKRDRFSEFKKASCQHLQKPSANTLKRSEIASGNFGSFILTL